MLNKEQRPGLVFTCDDICFAQFVGVFIAEPFIPPTNCNESYDVAVRGRLIEVKSECDTNGVVCTYYRIER